MARILILAQPSELFAVVEHALSRDGYFVRFVHDPTTWTTQINALLPDLVIVDASCSTSAARELYVRMRNRQSVRPCPILILGSGADAVAWGALTQENIAHLERPLQPHSLLERVRALLRSNAVDDPQGKITVADLVIDPVSHQVIRSGKVLSITQVEFRLLYHLASQPNTVYRRDQLLRVLAVKPRFAFRAVDVHMRHLRMKIEKDPRKPRMLRSVRAQGYCFHIPIESLSTSPTQPSSEVEAAESSRDPSANRLAPGVPWRVVA